ncbi:alpha/beta hydrolase [Elioraea sp.]|uniref:alpha/beta hydrolase n=1 Tax=Elioraea sp. TaxID=2185103 RepID=UPI00307D02FE
MDDVPRHGRGPQKHPEMAAYQALSEAAFARYPDTTTLPLPIAREIQEEVGRSFARGGPEMAETVERLPQVHGRYMLCRCHYPVTDRPLPVLIYLHGGGWMWNSIYTHDRLIRSYAAASGLAVVAPDYSLSPDSRFPTAVEECVELVHWLVRRGAEWGLDPGRMVIGGDSAGANLTVATALRLRDGGGPMPRGLLLNYGVYDSDLTRPSYRAYATGHMLTAAKMKLFWDAYAPTPEAKADPIAAPLRADLRGLPPALMHVAELDVLHDENILMAERLKAAGVATELTVYRGMLHGFLRALGHVHEADQAVAAAGAWLKSRVA